MRLVPRRSLPWLAPAVGRLAALAAAVYVALRVDRSWIPHDDGMLGQSAIRVLDGQLPHRDFDAAYTGGLAVYHALVMAVLGRDLLSLRIALLVAFVLWLVVFRWLAGRLLPALPADVVTALAALLSVPQFPTPLPSWYNLFLLTAGMACLVRYDDTQRVRWLLAAGLSVGLSMLVKIVGLYHLAAGLVFLTYRATAAPPREVVAERRAGWWWLPAAGLAALCAMEAGLVREVWGLGSFLVFVLPTLALSGALAARLAARGLAWVRLRRLAAECGLLLVGALAPVVAFLVPYLASSSLGTLLTGVFVKPRMRLEWASQPVPPTVHLVVGAAVLVPLLATARWTRRAAWIAAGAIVATLLLLAGVFGPGSLAIHTNHALRVTAVVAVVAAGWRLRPHGAGAVKGAPSLDTATVAALAAAVALWALVQYPFAADAYVFYVAPLSVLLMAGLAYRSRSYPPFLLYAVVLAGYAVVNSAHVVGPSTERLALERAGIRVPPTDRDLYQSLVEAVDSVGTGPWIVALPDAPEVSYLTGRLNPTRTLYDFLDEPEGRTRRVLSLLSARDVGVVVLKEGARFSGPPPQALVDTLTRLYPRSLRRGPYTIRFR